MLDAMKRSSKRLVFLAFAGILFLGTLPAALCDTPARSEPGTEYLLHKQKADGLFLNNRVFQAIGEYHKALEINPASTAAYFNLAIAYYSRRDIRAAAWALRRLTTLDPRDEEALYNLACLCLYQRQTEKAKLYFEKARNCCEEKSSFVPRIEESLAFIQVLEKTDPSAKELLFQLLRKGLAPISLS